MGTTDAPETDLLRKNFKVPGAAAGEEERHCLGLSTAAWEASGFYRSDPASALQSKILGAVSVGVKYLQRVIVDGMISWRI